jgi:hypothetical protein
MVRPVYNYSFKIFGGVNNAGSNPDTISSNISELIE